MLFLTHDSKNSDDQDRSGCGNLHHVTHNSDSLEDGQVHHQPDEKERSKPKQVEGVFYFLDRTRPCNNNVLYNSDNSQRCDFTSN